jgi:bud site selection protein 20
MHLLLILNYRAKALKDEPYTQKEAEAAIGLRTDNGSLSRKSITQDVEVEMIPGDNLDAEMAT